VLLDREVIFKRDLQMRMASLFEIRLESSYAVRHETWIGSFSLVSLVSEEGDSYYMRCFYRSMVDERNQPVFNYRVSFNAGSTIKC